MTSVTRRRHFPGADLTDSRAPFRAAIDRYICSWYPSSTLVHRHLLFILFRFIFLAHHRSPRRRGDGGADIGGGRRACRGQHNGAADNGPRGPERTGRLRQGGAGGQHVIDDDAGTSFDPRRPRTGPGPHGSAHAPGALTPAQSLLSAGQGAGPCGAVPQPAPQGQSRGFRVPRGRHGFPQRVRDGEPWDFIAAAEPTEQDMDGAEAPPAVCGGARGHGDEDESLRRARTRRGGRAPGPGPARRPAGPGRGF